MSIITIIVWGLVLASSIWVAADATAHGVRRGLVDGVCDMQPAGWFFSCLFLWIVAFPLYLAMRPRLIAAAAKPRQPAATKAPRLTHRQELEKRYGSVRIAR